MQLNHLALTHFRNFARLDLDVPGGSVLLVGGNAQGKTSLLEAIYYLATFTSFHASQDRQLISFFLEREPLVVTRIIADFQYTGEHPPSVFSKGSTQRMEIRLIREHDEFGITKFRKEILVNGVVKKMGEAIGLFNAVLFLPQMLRIVEGSPDDRRRYLNLSLGQVIPRYAMDLADYSKVLTQRNALLKSLSERGGDRSQMDYWDEKISAFGARIIFARIHAIRELERLAALIHRDLTHGKEILRLDYQPAYDPLSVVANQLMMPLKTPSDRSNQSIDQIQRGYLERLKALRAEEIQRGLTSIGPHRDELRFISNGIDLGLYGSRGQGRSAVLAFKLAEVIWMKEKSGQMPVLLLDEVLAELDPLRREDLLGRLSECEQALLTTTDLDSYPKMYLQSARVWQVSAGQVIE